MEYESEKVGRGEAYLAFRADEIAARRGVLGFVAFVEGFEREVKGQKQRLADNDKVKAAGSDASGAPLSGGTLDAAKTFAAIGDEVAVGLKAQCARLQREENEFLSVFEQRAKLAATGLLSESKARVQAEQQRYGLRAAGEHHAMTRSSATADLSKAAKALLTARAPLEALHNRLRDITMRPPSGDREAAAAEEKRLQAEFSEKAMPYFAMRAEKEAQFPVLAAYTALPKLEDDWTGTSSGLKSVSEGGQAMADRLGETVDEKLLHIKSFQAALEGGESSIWSYERIVETTKGRMGLAGNALRLRMVEDKVAKDEKVRAAKNEWASALAFAIAVLGAIATVGSGGAAAPFVMAGTAVAGAGLSGYLTVEELREYQLASSAAGTDFDKARALSGEDPSLLPVMMSVAGLVLDVVAAGAACSRLIKVVNSAKAITEVEQAARLEAQSLQTQGKLVGGSEAEFTRRFTTSTEQLVAAENEALVAAETRQPLGFDEQGQLRHKSKRLLLNQGPAPTCGPVSCAMVSHTMGRKVDAALVSEMVKVAGPEGTPLETMKGLLTKQGIVSDVNLKLTVDDLKAATSGGNPAVAVIKNVTGERKNEVLHAVVVDGVTTRMGGQEVVAIRNPWGKAYYETVDAFQKTFTGQGIVVHYAKY